MSFCMWVTAFKLKSMNSTHRFVWNNATIFEQRLYGFVNDKSTEFHSWRFSPPDYINKVPQNPLPLHMNLWLFQGHSSSEGKEVELIVKSFKFKVES